MRYLLDTNTVIAWLVRQDRAVVAAMVEHHREVASSAIVLHELYYGAFNSARLDRNLAEIGRIGLTMLPFDAEDARAAAEIRAVLRRAGTPIGAYDILIAGQAMARNVTVVTNNVGEFARVEGLRIEDWTMR